MRLEHHLVGGYVRYISPYIIIYYYYVTCSHFACPLQYQSDFPPCVYLYAEFVYFVLLQLTSRIVFIFSSIRFEM